MVRIGCSEGGGSTDFPVLWSAFNFKHLFNSINNVHVHVCINQTKTNKIKNKCKKSTITVGKAIDRNGWLYGKEKANTDVRTSPATYIYSSQGNLI